MQMQRAVLKVCELRNKNVLKEPLTELLHEPSGALIFSQVFPEHLVTYFTLKYFASTYRHQKISRTESFSYAHCSQARLD
jgi:hypothetical protein